jgi:O-antigen/teichoic acid export membrane protein
MDSVADRRAPSGRSSRLTSGVATSLLSRGASMAVPVILIPLTYRYFGPTQYAAWATIVATTSMFLWADLGLGNGLLTKVTPLLAAGDLERARELVSTAYAVLGAVALLLVGALAGSTQVVSWAALLGLDGAEQVSPTVFIVLGMMLLNIPLSLVQRVQYAAGEVVSSNLIQLAGPAVSLLFGIAGVAAGWPFLWLVGLIAAGPLAANAAAAITFYRRRPELRPRVIRVRSSSARPLLTMGLAFLFIQVCSSVAMNADPVIAAHVVGVAGLDDFSVTTRVFLLLGGLLTVITLPLWPAAAEALATGDVLWVRRVTLRISAVGSALVLVSGLVIVGLGDPVMRVLLGAEYQPDRSLMIGLVLLWTIVAAASPMFMVQNSVGLLRPQFVAWPIFLAVSLALKYVVAQRWGIEVIPVLGAALYGCVLLPTAIVGYRRATRTRTGGTRTSDVSVS